MGGSLKDRAAEAMEQLMSRIQPHLGRIAFVFGNKFSLSLIVRAEGKPGCLIFGNRGDGPDELIKSLQEAKELAND